MFMCDLNATNERTDNPFLNHPKVKSVSGWCNKCTWVQFHQPIAAKHNIGICVFLFLTNMLICSCVLNNLHALPTHMCDTL